MVSGFPERANECIRESSFCIANAFFVDYLSLVYAGLLLFFVMVIIVLHSDFQILRSMRPSYGEWGNIDEK